MGTTEQAPLLVRLHPCHCCKVLVHSQLLQLHCRYMPRLLLHPPLPLPLLQPAANCQQGLAKPTATANANATAATVIAAVVLLLGTALRRALIATPFCCYHRLDLHSELHVG